MSNLVTAPAYSAMAQPSRSVPSRVREQAARRPTAAAVVSGDQTLDYASLLNRADHLAARLQTSGLGPGSRVAICAPQSVDFIVAALATLTIGAAYVPIDPSYPAARRTYLAAQAPADALLTTSELVHEAAPECLPVLIIDRSIPGPARALERPEISSDDLAYVIFTSGSTGTPKGVEIPHGGLTNLVDWHHRRFALTPLDRTSLIAGVGFDASVWELWPSLVVGATVVIPPPPVRHAPTRLRDWLVDQEITLGFVPTVLTEQLIALGWPARTRLRTLLTGGDALRRRPPAGLPFTLVNNYGPTECTVVATSGVVTPGLGQPTIGWLIDGLTAAVLDPDGREVPAGTAGELYLGGAGLARGYAGQPELTAERFVQLGNGTRAYRTGDLVVRQADGSFDFQGRADDQVQIRGHRIEPGEIAAALACHPGVTSAMVVAQPGPGGEPSLAAYYVPRGSDDPGSADLRAHLKATLPSWMIPTAFVALAAFPQTANGKLDRTALPAPQVDLSDRVAPRTANETALVEIWSEVLGHHDLGVTDPFEVVGGHSLAAAQVDARIASRLGVAPGPWATVSGLTIAAQAIALAESAVPSLPLRPYDRAAGPAPATAAQRRLWLLDQVTEHRSLYNNGLLFRMSGSLDAGALRAALNTLVERHEILRTAFVDGPDGPRQLVQSRVELPLRVTDLRDYGSSGVRVAEEQQHRLVTEPFDLRRPPLLRALLLRYDDQTAELLLGVHHIAFDGASIEVVLDDLAELYAAGVEHRAARLPALPVQPYDVGWWEAATLNGRAGPPLRDYWSEQFATPVAPLALPTERPRPTRPAFRGSTVSRALPPSLSHRLAGTGAEHGSTAGTLLAALTALLHRHTRQTDLVIGIPVAGRTRTELEPLVGCFVNTVPLRCRVDPSAGFDELRRTSYTVLAGALAHQELPFEQILAEAERHGSAAADLVRVMLAVQPRPAAARALPHGRWEFGSELHHDTARFDLTFVLEYRDQVPTLTVEYDRDLFARSAVTAMLDQLLVLLGAGLDTPATAVGALPIMSPEQARQAAECGDGGPVDLGTRPVIDLVDATAARQPTAEAVVCGEHRLSYAEVVGRTGALSGALAARGVRLETPVVVGLERSAASVVALLGVMRSGGVYVPLDPAYPDERLRQVLDDLGPSTLVTSAALQDRLHRLCGKSIPATVLLDPTGQVVGTPESEPVDRPPVSLRNAAYVVYTSGSTGRPKGVVLEHRGLLNLVRAKINRFHIEPDARVLQYVSFGFGVSVADVLTTLVAGATLVVRGPEPLAGRDLARTLRNQRITHLVAPPSVLATMPETPLPLLRTVVVGGEPCAADMVQRWAPGRRFVQAYGPTEATVCSSTTACVPDGGRPPVGRPLPGVRMLIVDENLTPVPPGMVGEVLIGGVGLARGYLGRPDLTAERFVPDPTGQHPGERCYRTGDLGRIRPDGQFELLGRDDAQLQLRGIRVEAGDVEAALRAHSGVAEAAVAIRRHTTSGDLLIGYVVPAPDAKLDPAAVRTFLRDRLPSGLVPAAVFEIEALPRTGSGKLDRRALPGLPETAVRESRRPGTLTEELLARIWSDLLHSDDPAASPDVDEDFFAAGGQSLIAAQLVSRIRDRFSTPCSILDLYDAPTVAALALLVDARSGHPVADEGEPDVVADPELPITAHPERLSAAQRRIWFLDRLHPGTAAYHIPLAWRLSGPVDPESLIEALTAVVERHQVLRTRITEVDGQPRGELRPAADFRVERARLADEQALDTALAELSRRPFDLATDLPIRATLLEVAGAEVWVLALVVHHVAFDGWSVGVLAQELSAGYAARAVGQVRSLPALVAQYADTVPDPYAEPDPNRVGYWRERLAGAPQALALPLDRARPAQPSGRGAIHEFAIPAPFADGVRSLAAAERTTTFTVLLAAFASAAAGWTGAEDVLVGVPAANRDRPLTQDLIGCYINTVPIRIMVDSDSTGRQLIHQLRTALLDDLEHALDFEQLVDAVGADRSRAVPPLVQALFVAADTRGGELLLPRVEVRPMLVDPGAAKLDLSVSVDTGASAGGAMPVQLTYSTDVFDAATADRLAEQFVSRLAGLLGAPDQPAGGLPLGEADRAETEDVPTPAAEGSVLELYRAQVRRVPDQRAVVDDRVALSYAELDRRSRAVAAELRRRGAGPETTVGLLAERSVDAVVGLLGVLQAGAAYVPVDPAQPAARISAILDSAGADLVITQRALATLIPDRADVVMLEEAALADPDRTDLAAISPRSLAYVIATSGSTGTPKPVAVEHRQLHAYVDAVIERCDLAGMGSFAVASTLAADLGHTSLFSALCTGATLRVIGPTAAADPMLVADLLRRDPVDVLKIVPAQLNAWLSGPDPAAVLPRRRLVLGGDVAGWALVDRVRELALQLRVFNHYGPTEATVGALTQELTDLTADRPPSVPLGSPLPHAVARVLDDELRPVPAGVGGELFLGGAGVARGYLGQPELTAQRFVPDPYASDPDAQLYRTGDRVRRRFDGTCEFLGRTDEQVKIRGYRVEPGEVAAALRRHSSVRDAAVLVDRDEAGESRLLGFVVPHDSDDRSRVAMAQDLRDHLASLLPAAMVPARLLVLDALPLTRNGKIDRTALLAVPALDAPAPQPSRRPSTERERQVAEIWAEVLHANQVGADDNFFALGGHSLLATQVVSRLRQRLGLEVAVSALFEFPTIARLARALDAAGPAALPPLGPAPADGPIPLSYGQRRLWFLDQATPGESTYNLPYALRLRGRLDADRLERSLERIVASHDALRSTFGSADGEPCVVVHPARPVPLERVDLSAAPYPEAAVRERVDAEFRRPFDLARGPLYRWALLQVGAGEHVLLLSFHHIVFDGWSFGVLLDELADCYAAVESGRNPELPRRTLGYRDYAHWQTGWGPALAAQQDYWTRQLAGAPAALALPTDRPRPPRMTHRGDVVWLTLPAALTDRVKGLAADRGATVFMVLLAAYQALLARHTHQQDLAVGTPVAGRRDAQTERMIGFFVNMLALRTDLSGEPSFSELIRRVRATTLAAYEHQDLPFDRLVEELRPERDLSRPPVFQTIFTLHNQPAPRTPLPGITWTTEPGAVGVAKYDLSLVLTERDGGLTGALEYNTDLFDRATADRLADRFQRLLEAAVAEPELPYTRLAVTGPDEKAELDRWNDTAAAQPEPALITELFARTVADRPGAVALTGEDATLTYAELDERANQLAHHLINLGVGSEQLVGLQVDRSAEMVVALLGILKAGAAYVPLDPGYPRERLDYMLADAGAAALVTTSSLAGSTAFDGPIVRLDADRSDLDRQPETAPAVSRDPDQLAYVLYTSGSTGRPKGVEITHRSVVNALLSPGQPTLTADDVVLAVVSICFDGSVTELLRPLVAGARLVVAPRAVVTDGVRLVELVRTSGATAMMVPTPFGRILVEAGWPGDGRLKLSLGGEAMTPDLATALLPRTGELWNEYGPTETTVLSTSALITDPTRVNIGQPIDNTRIAVLDSHQRPVPVGVPGEICIGGTGLARGYHDRPALTAERFIPDPSPDHPGERLYRSGDLGRWRTDGTLEHLGRLDHQVKLRGYRIETGEIEVALESHPQVRQAAVVLRRDGAGDGQLIGYAVPEDWERPPSDRELRDHLARQLPDYMVPARLVLLAALPKTPVGKVDRSALPVPVSEAAARETVAPRTATETRIATVWVEVLGLDVETDPLGIDDDFFALGGQSMKAVRAVRRIDARLTVLDLFAHPTIRLLAAYLEGLDGSEASERGLLHRLSSMDYEQAELTLVAIPFGGGGAISYRELAAHLPPTWAVAGLEPPGHDFARRDEPLVDSDELAWRTADAIVAEIPGDVVLYGHCVGSALAVAIARRLEDAGRKVLGVAVGANFPAARIPGPLGRLARLWPGSRKSDRGLQDALVTLGGLAESLPVEEQRLLARNVRHDAEQAEAFYGAAFEQPESHRLAAPLVCVMGGEDRLSDFAVEQVQDWELFSDRVELEVIAGAEHFFNRQQAPELAATLTAQVARWREPAEPEGPRNERPAGQAPRSRSRLADFALVVLGQLVSMIGTGITTFALGVWAWQVTGRLETFAAVQLFGLLPAIVAGPFAGVVADRIDRRKVMIGCDLAGLATALALTLLVLGDGLRIWQLYVVVSAAGIAAAFRQPAYLAGATQLVPKRYLGNANGLLQLGTASGLVFAQLLGGALMAVAGLRGAVLIDLASYACALVTLAVVRFPDALFRRRRETFRAEIVGGWRYLLARKPLLMLTGFFTGANTFGGIVFVLVSPLALTYLTTASLGTVLAAQGVGMLAGGALMAVWGGTERRVTGMVGSVGLFAVSALLIGLWPGLLPAALGMFGIGVCAALISAHWLALVQVKVPSGMQGRVVATCLMLARLATPIGLVLVGPVVDSLLTPLVAPGGPLAELTLGLAPTVTGRAMAVAVVVTGALALIWTALGLAARSLRDADHLLPDASGALETPAPGQS